MPKGIGTFIIILAIIVVIGAIVALVSTNKTASAATISSYTGSTSMGSTGSTGTSSPNNDLVTKFNGLTFDNNQPSPTQKKKIAQELALVPPPMYGDLTPVTDPGTIAIYNSMWISYYVGKSGGNYGWISGNTYWCGDDSNKEFVQSATQDLPGAGVPQGKGGIIPLPTSI